MKFYAYKEKTPLFIFVRYGTLWYGSSNAAEHWMAESPGMQSQLDIDLRSGELKEFRPARSIPDQYGAAFNRSLEEDRQWHRDRLSIQACRARSVPEGVPEIPRRGRKPHHGAENAQSVAPVAPDPDPEPVPAKVLAIKILDGAAKPVTPGTLFRAIRAGTQDEFKAVVKLLVRHGRLKTVRMAGRLFLKKA